MLLTSSDVISTLQPRNPEQTEDQSFDNRNNQSLLASLLHLTHNCELTLRQISSQTKRPVRVIRGAYSAKNAKERRIQSQYAPAEGSVNLTRSLRNFIANGFFECQVPI